MLSDPPFDPYSVLILVLLIILDLAYLSAYKLGLEVTVYFPGGLWCSGALLNEPGAYLGGARCVEFLQG